MSALDIGSSGLFKSLKNQIQHQLNHLTIKHLPILIDRYFQAIAPSDLLRLDQKTWAAIFVSHFNLFYERNRQSKVRVFNPSLEQDAWNSTHTVIQIAHDDIPFLVDSTRMVLNRYGLEMHFILHFGGLKLVRDAQHRMVEVIQNGLSEGGQTEAPIYIEIDRVSDSKLMECLRKDILDALNDVQLAVSDWHNMVERIQDCLNELENYPKTLNPDDVSESKDFLRWLCNNNFTFLGARDYRLLGEGKDKSLEEVSGSSLGVLRDDAVHKHEKHYSEMPIRAREMALAKDTILSIGKTDKISSVHRAVRTDKIGVKQFDEQGNLIGERRFIGLYTSRAYHSNPMHIPFLSKKVARVIQQLGFPSDSHDGKEAVHILETLPRDDLFQTSFSELFELTKGILELKERKQVRLFILEDAFHRYYSCYVFAPNHLVTTELANKMQQYLLSMLNGKESSYTILFAESVLARIHFIIRVDAKKSIAYSILEMEQQLTQLARSWQDDLKQALLLDKGEELGLQLFSRYQKSFPGSYTEIYSVTESIADINKIESLLNQAPQNLGLEISIYLDEDGRTLRLKLFQMDHQIILSDVLPILENMGMRVLSERPHLIKGKDNQCIWIHDFDLSPISEKPIDLLVWQTFFPDALRAVWFGMAENDGLNRLILATNINWRETVMLRAYAKYFKQIGFALSQNYIEDTLLRYANMTRHLVNLFNARFHPDHVNQDQMRSEQLALESALESVNSLDEDKIIRRYLEVILATVRTNYFQKNKVGKDKDYVAFKFDPAQISDLPLPRPKHEIFVYSPRMEGIHLRAGQVARGGLRWSDRREDFRTEVLGLMKAQQVKNTVIVPEGAKGGFVVKAAFPGMTREAWQQEGVACYSTFISGLLDLTDNISHQTHEKIIPPAQVICYDKADPYLVVAADKGTATFSDIANQIAQTYGFWLGDAFASGGSVGYDHKKIGITSRGVWVSVKRHFRELGIHPEQDDFTVVGIGDMSGDVFGNGLLLSRHIKLLAAYNGMDIFIDPNPNPEVSYEERQRLFQLPRSSWQDYDVSLISSGGGIFSRSAKSIKISEEMKQVFHIQQDALMPNELIQKILCSPVDLIWNGGIGTFVKSSSETHADVGDKSNDAIRINASALNARVIAEGGNLGMTQLARVEFSLGGGIVNTDFIDNSAGVDCSDHEVNIKILLNPLVAAGELTLEARNALLEKMTNEVAELVLFDNDEQTQMLSLEASVASQTIDLFSQYLRDLEKQGRIDRHLEYLPSDEEILERKQKGQAFTRPEIAMLLAYCKMYLKRDILESDILSDAFFDRYLFSAFPKILCEQYQEKIKNHRLRNEIIATQLCKAITDRMGINFVERLQRETGVEMPFIIRAFAISERIFSMEELWSGIKKLDHSVSADVQYKMMLQLYYLIRRGTRWFLRNRKSNIAIQVTVDELSPLIQSLTAILPEVLDEIGQMNLEKQLSEFVQCGVPELLSRQIAQCSALFTALDIAQSASHYKLPLSDLAKAYYGLGETLRLNWLRESMSNYSVQTLWDELARAGFRDDLDRVQGKLAAKLLSSKLKEMQGAESIAEKISIWIKRCRFLSERWYHLLDDMQNSDRVDYVTYSVVLRELFDFAQSA